MKYNILIYYFSHSAIGKQVLLAWKYSGNVEQPKRQRKDNFNVCSNHCFQSQHSFSEKADNQTVFSCYTVFNKK